jgi:anti-sigma factor RsiW
MTTLAESYWSPRQRLTDIAYDICLRRYVGSGAEEEIATPCPELELALSRQADGRLGRADRRAVRAHLPTCGSCSTFADDLRAQRAALEQLARIPVPASFNRPRNSRASLAQGRHLYQ